MLGYRWHDLTPHWEELRAVADGRNQQKQNFQSSKYWNIDSHFIGLLGEQVYALEYGLGVDLELKVSGDGGCDFGRTDIKACTYWTDPFLKHPVRPKYWPDVFVLVAVDVDGKRGKLVGQATAKQLQRDGTITNFGHGNQYVLYDWELSPVDDPTLVGA